jgi:hypothetical protein
MLESDAVLRIEIAPSYTVKATQTVTHPCPDAAGRILCEREHVIGTRALRTRQSFPRSISEAENTPRLDIARYSRPYIPVSGAQERMNR